MSWADCASSTVPIEPQRVAHGQVASAELPGNRPIPDSVPRPWVEARRQKRPKIEHVEPTQEPQVRAESFTSSKRTLSTEARELLAKVDEGGIPLMITRNLERIAGEHGITVSDDMTPNDVVGLLRELAEADGTTMQTANGKQTSSIRETGNQGVEKAKKQPDIFADIIWPDMSDSNRDE